MSNNKLETIIETTFDNNGVSSMNLPNNLPNNLPQNLSQNDILMKLEEIYKYIKSVHGEKITPTNIILITSELIQIVEKYKNLTGMQKKMLVINTIKRIVNEQLNTPEEQMALTIIIDNTVPNIIDGFVSAINGLMNFTKNNKKCSSFFGSCFSCCK